MSIAIWGDYDIAQVGDMLVIFGTPRNCRAMLRVLMNHMQIKFDEHSCRFHSGGGVGSHVPEPGSKNQELTPCQGGELWDLLEGFIGAIIGAVGASAGAVRAVSPDGRELRLVGAVGLPPEACERESVIRLDCGVCGKAASNLEIELSDASACAQHSSCIFSGENCRYVVAVPVRYRGNLLGVLTIFFADAQDIPDDARRVFQSFAEIIGITLENTRQNRESHRASQMSERQMMANEIHDSLAQTLVYTKMRMSLLSEALRTHNAQLASECARDVDEALGKSQKTVRELITHFRCRMDPLGLQNALQTLADEFHARTGITLGYTNRMADLDLPLEHELQAFHIVREALANIAAHSGATHAQLTVGREEGHYVFTIEDNGSGTCNGIPVEGHYGLMIMRERAHRIGGNIVVKSFERLGTIVRLSFPDPDTCKE